MSEPIVPCVVHGVILHELDGKEWLDFGSLRPTEEQSRRAGKEFYADTSKAWQTLNRPRVIRKFKLVPFDEPAAS